MKLLITTLGVVASLFIGQTTHAATMASRMAGKILLQVQSKGEGWYVHPGELQRYFLGRPNDAFAVMRSTGLGISNSNLERIALSTSSSSGDTNFAKTLSGRILLQVQSRGEAWYISPSTLKRYYLGRPDDAFVVMRTLGVGITNADLSLIPISPSSAPVPGVVTTQPAPAPNSDTTPSDSYGSQRTTILNALNSQRSTHGLGSVRISDMLNKAAQTHADDMTTRGYYSLTSPEGIKATDRPATAGYKAHSVGVWLDSVVNGASEVISQWMSHSPANFSTLALGSDYHDLGIGVGRVNGTPVYVLIFALSEEDYFTTATAGLADLAKVRNDMLARVNQERQLAGLSTLVMNTKLNNAAQGHTDDMLAQSYYSHNSLDGSTPAQRVTAAGYVFSAMGENIAKGQQSVKEVMDAWMASPEHRENILNTTFADIGIGLSYGKDANGYEILWAQSFGRLR